MNTRTWALLGGAALVAAAAGIWMRDRHWAQTPADTLPLLLGLPLIAFLGGPWKPAKEPVAPPLWQWAVGLLVFAIGWTGEIMTAMAAGWAWCLGCWMKTCFEPLAGRQRLVWIGLLSFPWLLTDWPRIGWAFRISAAEMVTRIFALLAMPVMRNGTSVEVVGLPVEVEAACAGWNLLQLSMLSGLAVSAMEVGKNSRFYLLLALLPVIAWIANTIRILLLAVIGLSWGTEAASGPLHTPTAMVVLALVLMVTRMLAGALESKGKLVRRVVA